MNISAKYVLVLFAVTAILSTAAAHIFKKPYTKEYEGDYKLPGPNNASGVNDTRRISKRHDGLVIEELPMMNVMKKIEFKITESAHLYGQLKPMDIVLLATTIPNIFVITGNYLTGRNYLAEKIAQLYEYFLGGNIVWLRAYTEEQLQSDLLFVASNIGVVDPAHVIDPEDTNSLLQIFDKTLRYYRSRHVLIVITCVHPTDKIVEILDEVLDFTTDRMRVILTSPFSNWDKNKYKLFKLHWFRTKNGYNM